MSKAFYLVVGFCFNVNNQKNFTSVSNFLHTKVTEETSKILQELGYSCECRGLINVKGKGELRTYFVCTETAKFQGMGLNWGYSEVNQNRLRFASLLWRRRISLLMWRTIILKTCIYCSYLFYISRWENFLITKNSEKFLEDTQLSVWKWLLFPEVIWRCIWNCHEAFSVSCFPHTGSLNSSVTAGVDAL